MLPPPSCLLQVPRHAPAARDPRALSYDIILVASDTGTHIVGEVQTAWRLQLGRRRSTALLDSSLRVMRVLVDGKPNTRLSRTMYGRSGSDMVVPHEKEAGDTLAHPGPLPRRSPAAAWCRDRPAPGRGALAGGGRRRPRALWLPVPDEPGGRVTVAMARPGAGRGPRAGERRADGLDTLPYGQTTWHYRARHARFRSTRLAVATGPYAVTVLRARTACAGCAPVDAVDAACRFGRGGRGPSAGRARCRWLARVPGPLPYPGLAHAEAAIAGRAVASAEIVLYGGRARAAGPAERGSPGQRRAVAGIAV